MTEPGSYTLVAEDSSNSCTNDTTIIVSENMVPPIVDAGTDIALPCDGNDVTIGTNNTSTGPNFTFEWTSDNGFIFPLDIGATFSTDEVGTYILNVTNDVNGCTASDTIIVMDMGDNLSLINPTGISPECLSLIHI